MIKGKLFWLWMAVREFFRNGKTDYKIGQIIFPDRTATKEERALVKKVEDAFGLNEV